MSTHSKQSGFKKTSILIFVLLLFWEISIRLLGIADYLVPTPQQVLQALSADAGLLLKQTSYTFIEWLIGLLLSIILGLVIAVTCFRWQRVHDFFSPLLIVSQTIPFLAFAPLLLIWLGLGMTPKVVLVVLSCAFPIALAVEQGLQEGRQEFQVMVAMMKLNWTQALYHVYFPAALPHFFTGLKISASYAFLSAVMAELIGSESGLGVYLTRAQSSYRTDRVVASLVIIVAISLLTTFSVDQLRRRVVFWNTVKK